MFKVLVGSAATVFIGVAAVTGGWYLYQRHPYASRGSPDTPNSQDNIFAQSGGELTLELTEDGDGFSSQFHVGVGAS